MDMDVLAAAWRERSAERQSRLAADAARARDAARRAARALIDEFGASQVWLFGSLVWGRPHSLSDIDLAVEGVAPERHFAALARACEVAGGQVDLVPLEDCSESLRRRILALASGVVGVMLLIRLSAL